MVSNNSKAGDGTLRRNDRKYEVVNGKYVVIDGKEKYPDYKGKIDLVVGDTKLKVYVSAWVRKGQDGTPFMSLALEYPQNEQRRLALAGAPVQPQQPAMDIQPDSLDEYLPF